MNEEFNKGYAAAMKKVADFIDNECQTVHPKHSMLFDYLQTISKIVRAEATKTSPDEATDRRAAFEAWVRKEARMPAGVTFNWDAEWVQAAFAGWKARGQY